MMILGVRYDKLFGTNLNFHWHQAGSSTLNVGTLYSMSVPYYFALQRSCVHRVKRQTEIVREKGWSKVGNGNGRVAVCTVGETQRRAALEYFYTAPDEPGFQNIRKRLLFTFNFRNLTLRIYRILMAYNTSGRNDLV
jgi:hypothetical protein